MTAAGSTAPKPYRFLFSYSWKNRDDALQRFYEDLSTEVRGLLGDSIERVAFRDRINVQAGTNWSEALMEALVSSQVLVFLVSADYLQSDYCGKELKVFLERIEAFRKAHPNESVPKVLQPVRWMPTLAPLPDAVAALQPEDDGYPPEYAARGLRSLALGRGESEYRTVVEVLANRIANASRTDPLSPLRKYQRIDDVPNAFLREEPGPPPPVAAPSEASNDEPATEVQCVYLAPRRNEAQQIAIHSNGETRLRAPASYGQRGWFWQPFRPPLATPIGSLVQQVIIEFPYREIVLTDDAGQLKQWDSILPSLDASKHIVLLFVDAWALYLDNYRELARKLDELRGRNCVVIVPWNDDDTDTKGAHSDLEEALLAVFQSKHPVKQSSQFFRPRVTNIDELRKILPDVLTTLRDEIESRRAAERRFIKATKPSPQIRTSSGSGHE